MVKMFIDAFQLPYRWATAATGAPEYTKHPDKPGTALLDRHTHLALLCYLKWRRDFFHRYSQLHLCHVLFSSNVNHIERQQPSLYAFCADIKARRFMP